jgi:hypothetical protein
LIAWILAPASAAETTTRFQALHVYVDSKEEPLAAYQVSVRATHGDVRIVGIEGGESVAFQQPPFYDPKAIQQERVILAAFSTKPRAELPAGRTRVATIHLRVGGNEEPEFEIKLQAAADHEGRKFSPAATVQLEQP